MRTFERGLSLVELIVFMVIVGVAVAGVLSVMNLTTAKSADPMVRKQAIAIAEGMLEEILLKDFSNPPGGFTGAATPANRALFDDVSDYAGYTTTGIYDLTGTPIPALSGYGVSVTVANQAVGGVPAAAAKRVTVTVTAPGGETITLSGFRMDTGS
ncbi:prepilin-type cleavage/methylation domain-containing protein [Thiobacter aerophilum]|uniref:Prepilin-type cleavage/methylation domain-containing protein n=1 Tax=Thiobacter aerophilum TaxID=3121275 RepID=A0ABV0EFG3_9BURK